MTETTAPISKRISFKAISFYIGSMIIVSALSIGFARRDGSKSEPKTIPPDLLAAILAIKSGAEVGVSFSDFGTLVRDATTKLSVAKSSAPSTPNAILDEAEVAISIATITFDYWRRNQDDVGSGPDRQDIKSLPQCFKEEDFNYSPRFSDSPPEAHLVSSKLRNGNMRPQEYLRFLLSCCTRHIDELVTRNKDLAHS